MTYQIRTHENKAQLRVLKDGQVVDFLTNDNHKPIKGLRFEDNCAIFETSKSETKAKGNWVTVPNIGELCG